MKNNIPVIYWTFRYVWTSMHFIIAAAAATALFMWAQADDHALRIWETSKTNVLDVQHRVSNVIPWPWAMDDNDSGGSSEAPSSYNDGNSGNVDPGETLRIQVVSNIHVREEPTPDSKSIQVLDAGSWADADCKVENGALVEKGPYGPSSRWDHIQGLGYVSDAYVPIVTNGLPSC
ncbi:MAG: hypothetical protein ACK5MT_11930 [Actinomycetales bacterium]